MNRRSSIKSILGLSLVGVTGFSFYKWIDYKSPVNPNDLLNYQSLIAELAETIIPRTTTPGAKDVRVEEYIIKILVNCCQKNEQRQFLQGLEDVENYTKDHYDKKFETCTEYEKAKILTYFENRDSYSTVILNKINNKLFGKSFFSLLKMLTVEGYCVSELGATRGLAYDYVPGNFESCIPLKNGQHSWATK